MAEIQEEQDPRACGPVGRLRDPVLDCGRFCFVPLGTYDKQAACAIQGAVADHVHD
ncbi:hypothetical protein [Streptomyces sp. 2A115]|uniref:hypothetical protein n=1 Tax=Streptomyces sp. 2A115 TaxID=3457439 RepID=UPI003FD59725